MIITAYVWHVMFSVQKLHAFGEILFLIGRDLEDSSFILKYLILLGLGDYSFVIQSVKLCTSFLN